MKFKLTALGPCCNPECGRQRFLELDEDLSEACSTCDPPRVGLPTAFRMIAEAAGVGALPAPVGEFFERTPRLRLTPAGPCRRCGAVRFMELLRLERLGLCPGCFDLMLEEVGPPSVYQRSGGRIPPRGLRLDGGG